MRLTALILTTSVIGWTCAHAVEIARPLTYEDWGNAVLTYEEAHPVAGVEIVWMDGKLLKRDFPQLESWNEEKIRQWLLENFAYIGRDQPRLNDIRNTPIPIDSSRRQRPALRPIDWQRSAVLEATGMNTSELWGFVDIKGFGHGARSDGDGPRSVEGQVKEFQSAKTPEDVDRLRVLDHSDGLTTLGEAIAELTRQRAAQALFEYRANHLQTVEIYALFAFPFHIIRDNHKLDRAAAVLRQSHLGRFQGLNVPTNLYVDPFGGLQYTFSHTAVDFGGVMIRDPLLLENFKAEGAESEPQNARAWRWGHEVAKAWEAGDRNAVYRHVKEMISPLTSQSDFESVQKLAHEYAETQRQRFERLRTRLGSVHEIFSVLPDRKFRDWQQAPFDELVRWSEKGVDDSRVRVVSILAQREEPVAKLLVQKALGDKFDLVRREAVQALRFWPEAEAVPLLEQHLAREDSYRVFDVAYETLSYFQGQQARALVDKAFKSENTSQVVAAILGLKNDMRPEVAARILEAARIAKPGLYARKDVRAYTLKALKGRSDDRSTRHLQKILRMDAEDLTTQNSRVDAIAALSNRSDVASLELLLKYLSDPNSAVATEAWRVLSQRKDPETWRRIQDLGETIYSGSEREQAYQRYWIYRGRRIFETQQMLGLPCASSVLKSLK